MNVTVHIERLVLEGLPLSRRQAPLVQAAVEAELARLLAAEGLAPGLATGGTVPRLTAPALQVGADTGPTHLGTQIAQAVYGGIGK
jgi:hypothetical protein